MLKKFLLALISFLFSVSFLFAEGVAVNYNGSTGDKSLDLELGNLNLSATADKDNFIKDMSATYNTSEATIKGMIETDRMEPADIFMSFEISRLSKKKVDDVVAEYKKSKARGWGFIAKQMGIKPGSPQFKELKAKAKAKNDKMKKVKGKDKEKGKGGKGK